MKCRTLVGIPLLLPLLFSRPLATAAPPAGPRAGAEFTTRYSHAAESHFDSAPGGGSVDVHSWRLGLGWSAALSGDTRLVMGAEWTRHELNLNGPRWLPERLQSASLPLGVSHRVNERWRCMLNLQPRIATAGSAFGSEGFDLPVLALARYAASPELAWSLGLRYSARSDVKLLPLVGAVWQFAPKWEAALTFPESAVSYRATSGLTVRAIAAFHGGDYRLDADPRVAANRTGRSLADAWLEYREIRVGIAAEHPLGATVSARVDLGMVVDQQFDYFDRGVELEGSSPAYFGLSLVGRF